MSNRSSLPGFTPLKSVLDETGISSYAVMARKISGPHRRTFCVLIRGRGRVPQAGADRAGRACVWAIGTHP